MPFYQQLKGLCVSCNFVRNARIDLECRSDREDQVRTVLGREGYAVEYRFVLPNGNIDIRAI